MSKSRSRNDRPTPGERSRAPARSSLRESAPAGGERRTIPLLEGILRDRIAFEAGAPSDTGPEARPDADAEATRAFLEGESAANATFTAHPQDIPIGAILERLRADGALPARAKDIDLRVVPCRLMIRSDAFLLEQTLRFLLAHAALYTERRGKILLGCRRNGDNLRIQILSAGPHPENVPAGGSEDERRMDMYRGPAAYPAPQSGFMAGMFNFGDSGLFFFLDVPIAATDSVRALRDGAAVGAQPETVRRTILVVEPESDVREEIVAQFADSNDRVATFADADAALAAVTDDEAWPDVLLIANDLPGRQNGLDIVIRMRNALNADLPAIVLTRPGAPAIRRRIQQAGCTIIDKPASYEAIRETVSQILSTSPAETSGRTPAEHRISVVDDNVIVAEDLSALLESRGYRVDTYTNAVDFLENAERAKSDCILLDVSMPEIDGMTLLKRLKSENREQPVIMITGYGNVSMAAEALKAGANDFLEKPVVPDQLLTTVENVLELGRNQRKRADKVSRATEAVASLTPRQRDIMGLVAEGHANKEIAYRLGISQRTVENHRAAMMTKLDVRTIADLVRLVMLVDE